MFVLLMMSGKLLHERYYLLLALCVLGWGEGEQLKLS